jgi:hypothetical protein
MILKENIWDNLVGSIYWDANQNIASFEYDGSFVTKGLEMAPFLMPLKEGTVSLVSGCLIYRNYINL